MNALGPALVAVSGDLTQRARRSQFAEARAWLASLTAPSLVVPGNHDIPLYDLVRRIMSPRVRYRHYVTRDLEPWFADDALAVAGIDTTKAFTTQFGRITEEQAQRAALRFDENPRDWRVLVAHHPLIAPEGFEHERASGSDAALPILERAGLDVILTGHLHRAHSEGAVGRNTSHTMIAVHAGTCMSTRLRGEPNGYNVVRFEDDAVMVTHREWNGHAFADRARKSYRRAPSGERVVKVA